MIEISMTSQQLAIYNGLYALRPAIAAFYRDGLQIKELPLESKSNLLGHLLREIDGGLRDIYKPTNKKSNDGGGHRQSIIDCFGLTDNSTLAATYLEIAKQFNEYAHRSNTDIENLKDPSEIMRLWEEFENVLYPLLGSFMGSTLRLDVLLERDEPNAIADGCLAFILEDTSKRAYFFQRLDKVGWLKSLYEQGLFDAKLNPEPIESSDNPGYFSCPYWYELSYVARIAPYIANNQNDYWQIITNIIDGIIAYHKDDGTLVRNFRTNDFIVHLISFLPDRYLKDDYFDTVKSIAKTEGTFGLYSFQNHFVPRFIEKTDKKNLLRCLDLMYSFNDNGSNYPKYTPLFDPYMIGPEIKKWNSDLCRICGIDGLKVLLQKLDQVKKDSELSFFASVDEADNQNRYQDKYSAKLVFSIIDYSLALSTIELQQVVEELLSSDSYMDKRIAFHLIDKRYDELKQMYWSYPSNPMDEYASYPEIFRLLKNNSEKFSEDEQRRTISNIDDIRFPDDLEITQGQIDYHKKRLAIALLPTHRPIINDYFKEISEKCSDEIEHPGYDYYIGSSVYSGTDIPTVDLESKDIREIIELYKNVQPSPLPFGLNSYNLDTDFSSIVSQQIVKYTEDIDDLIDAPSSMLRAWVWGLLSYLKQAPIIRRIENVFTVINHIAQKKEFWAVANAKSLLLNVEYSFLSDLLILVSKIDLSKASNLALEQIYNALITIHKNKIEEKNEEWDYRINSMYNRLSFKLYDAMIAVNYAYSKKMELTEGSHWCSELKTIIEKGIKDEGNNPDLFFALGHQHHSIWYIDKPWMETNIDKIFFNGNSHNQTAAVSGFMMHYALADKVIFDALLDKGVLTNILNDPDSYDYIIVNSIIHNLLEGVRKGVLDKKSIDSLIKTDNRKIYTEVINYVSNLKNEEANVIFVKSIWGHFIDAHSSKMTDTTKYFCKESYRWLRQINVLDEQILSWLMISAKYSLNQNFYAFVELLQPFFISEPQKAGIILLELIKNADYIYHPNLSSLVEKVYQAGLMTLADEICDACAKQGDFSLSDVYRKNHS